MRTDGPVVVALDGAPHSSETLQWAADEAVRRSADLLIVRAIDETWRLAPWAWYPTLVDSTSVEAELADDLADRAARVVDHHPHLTVRTHVMHGRTVPALRALSGGAQLLVVGAPTRSRPSRTGSLALHVAAHASCPVAAVRSDPNLTASPEPAVVVGVDGSLGSLAAARLAAGEAAMRDGRLRVVHARPTGPHLGGALPLATDDPDDPADKGALVVVESLQDEHRDLTIELALVDDDAADALVELGAGNALLVVGSRGLGTFIGMLLGSVSSAVIREATVPVLVARDHG
ncbi:universal stress protein [Cellulomonas sp.]|uniref:universal stress protein n=1 Tax=Cellulomonas sp. TaxID=40001 RepID=UPI001AFE9676|nr:universal stress protein [Cellulomonas sp.]MBO9555063.1 universal stress protein [Cellulomonas sp.]